jgi:hypothetical protein
MAGKVLSNAGSGQDPWILAGINWAIQNRAVVISMSLGAPVAPGQAFKQAYEQAAQAPLNAGALIVAAAGNEAPRPVGSPANCPSIMAVAAIDSNLQRAPFSCIGINPGGGEVDIAGPGVAVFSSTLRRSELVALTVADLQEREGRAVFADIRGKGGRVRTVPAPEWVKDAVAEWTRVDRRFDLWPRRATARRTSPKRSTETMGEPGAASGVRRIRARQPESGPSRARACRAPARGQATPSCRAWSSGTARRRRDFGLAPTVPARPSRLRARRRGGAPAPAVAASPPREC